MTAWHYLPFLEMQDIAIHAHPLSDRYCMSSSRYLSSVTLNISLSYSLVPRFHLSEPRLLAKHANLSQRADSVTALSFLRQAQLPNGPNGRPLTNQVPAHTRPRLC